MNQNQVKRSKFLALVLRHKPEKIGLTLDQNGWADLDDLLSRARANGKTISREDVLQIVAECDKKRYALSEDGRRIRAVQGHSTASVDLEFKPAEPPTILFHGTAQRFLEPILREGLKPGTRHYVHLSAAHDTAVSVGRRHGTPMVLEVAAARMAAAGHTFYQAENGVWLTAHVPPGFLNLVTGS